jgi:protein-tyrosine phosphatase
MYPGSVSVNLCSCKTNEKSGAVFADAYKKCIELYGPDDPKTVLLFCSKEPICQPGMSLSDIGSIATACFKRNTAVKCIALVEMQPFLQKYKFLLEDTTFKIYPNEIEEQLYVGSAGCLPNVKKLGITSVLTLTEREIGTPSGVDCHLHYNIADSLSADMATALEVVLPWIDEQISSNKKILVHCEQGQSRSVTVVVAYLCQSKNLKWYNALEMVKNCRLSAKPNEYFLKLLQEKYQ